MPASVVEISLRRGGLEAADQVAQAQFERGRGPSLSASRLDHDGAEQVVEDDADSVGCLTLVISASAKDVEKTLADFSHPMTGELPRDQNLGDAGTFDQHSVQVAKSPASDVRRTRSTG